MNEYRILFLSGHYSNWAPADESELFYITHCLNGKSLFGPVYDIETR